MTLGRGLASVWTPIRGAWGAPLPSSNMPVGWSCTFKVQRRLALVLVKVQAHHLEPVGVVLFYPVHDGYRFCSGVSPVGVDEDQDWFARRDACEPAELGQCGRGGLAASRGGKRSDDGERDHNRPEQGERSQVPTPTRAKPLTTF